MNLKKDLLWLLAGLLFAALYTGGVVFLGYEWGHSGVTKLQAAWDKDKANAKVIAAQVEAANSAKTAALQQQLDIANRGYEGSLREQIPSVADAVPVKLTAGTLKLRDATACPRGSPGTDTTASARAADAAATQALADRVQNSISAVRAGDAADKREHDLDAQIVGLQQSLAAIQQAYSTHGSASDGKH